MAEIETTIQRELEDQLSENIDVSIYSQGEAVDVHVEFPKLEETLAETLDGGPVETYSTLKFTVAQR